MQQCIISVQNEVASVIVLICQDEPILIPSFRPQYRQTAALPSCQKPGRQ